MTSTEEHLVGTFFLEKTNTTVANTLRRLILSETRSVGFRADLTNPANPGIKIRRNTGAIFNEMLAHRLTLLPLGVRRLDEFDADKYQCVLTAKNEKKGTSEMLHVTAADFHVMEKQADGTFVDLGAPAAAAMFPADPITKQTSLLVSLKSQWNPEAPPEEIDLTAYPVIGTGREFMGFCPVSQCSFENTLDTDPVRQDQFFREWLASFKKVADATAVPPEQLAHYKAEWNTMAIQRCFIVDERGDPASFRFTVESIGIRPVKEIVAEGLQAAITLLQPFADESKSLVDLGITMQPPESRMNGLDILFDGHEHTLGNLLQRMITELYLDTEAPDAPITYAGYKVRHPLQRIMTIRLGFRDGAPGDMSAIAKGIIHAAAARALGIFTDLGRSWASLTSTPLRSMTESGSSATAFVESKEV